jgi:hypothetical protein
MPSGARPRRSTASASFAHLFQPIKLEGDESSSSADEGKDGSEQVGASKKKGKRKTVYVPEESSGSEFEVGNASASGAGAEEEEDDDTITTEAATDDGDDLGSGGSDGGDTDVSGSVVNASSSRGGKAGRRRKGKGAGPSAQGRHASRPSMHANVVIRGANEEDGRPRPADGSHELPQRIEVPSKHPQSSISHMYNFFGPLWTALPTRKLAPPTQDERRACLSESVPTSAGKQLTDKEIEELLEDWTAKPFGVETSSVRDVGWYPGRFDPTSGSERAKWGGWYPQVSIASEDMAPLSDRCVQVPSSSVHMREADAL